MGALTDPYLERCPLTDKSICLLSRLLELGGSGARAVMYVGVTFAPDFDIFLAFLLLLVTGAAGRLRLLGVLLNRVGESV